MIEQDLIWPIDISHLRKVRKGQWPQIIDLFSANNSILKISLKKERDFYNLWWKLIYHVSKVRISKNDVILQENINQEKDTAKTVGKYFYPLFSICITSCSENFVNWKIISRKEVP